MLMEATCALLTHLTLLFKLVVDVVRGSVRILAWDVGTDGARTLCVDLAADHGVVNVLNRVVELFAHAKSDVRRLEDRHARFVEE